MNQRLPAFTLMEVMVALAITAVVVMLSFYGYRLIQLQFGQFRSQQSQLEDARRCVTLLQSDVFRARYLERQASTLRITQKQDTIIYQFTDQAVIRQYATQHLDTFDVHINMAESRFQKQVRDGLVDEVRLEIALSEFAKTLVLQKQYSAEEMIRWEDEH